MRVENWPMIGHGRRVGLDLTLNSGLKLRPDGLFG
jgi:hypothetical protein